MGGDILTKRKKIIIGFSCIVILLTIILATIVIRSEQRDFFIKQVQFPLVELQGIFNMQEKDGWDNPQLISNKTSTIIPSLWYGTASYSFPNKALSDEEQKLLARINTALNWLPMNDNYTMAEWTEDDIKKAKILNEALKDAGFAMDTTVWGEWDFFIKQCEILVNKLFEYGYF